MCEYKHRISLETWEMIKLVKFIYSNLIADYSLHFARVRKIGADPTGWPMVIRAVIE